MKVLFSLTGLGLLYIVLSSFCGFYVAQADAKLFNKSSQVILVRDGNHTVITMSNDFKGNVKDFAMVVPVPVVLQREQVKVVEQSIFDKLDKYSGPRLVEYHDENPCEPRYALTESMSAPRAAMSKSRGNAKLDAEDDGVTIEASYSVGEYDILVLSAKESDGLEKWLTDNGYKIPEGAAEVLTPYIRSNMKFFVVKVNLERRANSEYASLRPLQIRFDSPKFMLPIRLGMANAIDFQDLIVYGFTKKGRMETTNYRTVPIPTDQNIPLKIQPRFGEFYTALFDHSWQKEKNAAYLEYAWDLSSRNFVKCDPCATTPPVIAELREAGVDWVANASDSQRMSGGSDYAGDVFFTRLHVRYDRQHFPQDLQFQETPNQSSFQGRYVLNHPARGEMSCPEAAEYLTDVYSRRKNEVNNLVSLTGWDAREYDSYIEEYRRKADDARQRNGLAPIRGGALTATEQHSFYHMNPLLSTILVLSVVTAVFFLAEHWKRKG